MEPVGKLKGIKTGAQYCSMTGYGLVIGRNIGTAVSHDYTAPFVFTGKLDKVSVELN